MVSNSSSEKRVPNDCVELLDARQRRHGPAAVGLLADALALVDVVLVVDVADDLLEHVLDREQARRRRRTRRRRSPCGCALTRNSFSSTLRRLLSGMNTGGTQAFADVELGAARPRRRTAAGPWRAGCRRPRRGPRPRPGKREWPDSMTTGRILSARIVAIDHDHLRARHHDVAHLDLGNLEHRLEHLRARRRRSGRARGPRPGRRASCVEVARLARDRVGETPQPAARRARVSATTHTALFGDRSDTGHETPIRAGFPPRAPPCARASRARSWS